jgi:diacylglycerol kinase
LTQFLQAFRHAFAGLSYALATQWNMRVHVAAACLVVGAALWMRLSGPSVEALVLVIALVLTLELINTAIEALVDLQMPAPHPLAKVAKDCAAAAVLVAAAAAAVVGAVVFLTR